MTDTTTDGPMETIDGFETGNTVAPNATPGNEAAAAVIARHIPQGGDGLVDRPSEAIAVLGGPYRQLDMDGVIVGVSQQAIYETLTYLAQLEAITAKFAGALKRIALQDFKVPTAGVLAKHARTALQHKDVTDGK